MMPEVRLTTKAFRKFVKLNEACGLSHQQNLCGTLFSVDHVMMILFKLNNVSWLKNPSAATMINAQRDLQLQSQTSK